MEKIRVNKISGKRIYLDYYYWTSIILFWTDIIFVWNWHANNIVLRGINAENFDEYWVWYLQGKMEQFWVSKKDAKFYTWMIEHYQMERLK